MELRQLRYLLTIADEGSFTRAAEKLYVSQSALSQQIKLLERELDVVLLDRSGRRIAVTPAGAALLQQTRRTFAALDAAVVEIGELEALQRGELRIGAVETVVAYVLPRAVRQFTQQYPGVRLRIDEQADAVIEQRLLAGDAHLGLGFAPAIHAEIEAEPLYDEQLALIVTHAHPLAQHTSVQVADLDHLPLALLPPTSCTRTQWDAAAAQVGIQPHILLEINSIHGLLQAVTQTNTATILPTVALCNSPSGVFISIPLINPTPTRTVGVLSRRQGHRSRAAQAFVEIMKTINIAAD
jgi:LysR family cyn operon transcriptional activator